MCTGPGVGKVAAGGGEGAAGGIGGGGADGVGIGGTAVGGVVGLPNSVDEVGAAVGSTARPHPLQCVSSGCNWLPHCEQ